MRTEVKRDARMWMIVQSMMLLVVSKAIEKACLYVDHACRGKDHMPAGTMGYALWHMNTIQNKSALEIVMDEIQVISSLDLSVAELHTYIQLWTASGNRGFFPSPYDLDNREYLFVYVQERFFCTILPIPGRSHGYEFYVGVDPVGQGNHDMTENELVRFLSDDIVKRFALKD